MWLLTALSYFTTFLAGIAALIAALYVVSFAIPKAAFFARLIAFYFSILVTCTFILPVCLIFRLVGQGGSGQWAGGRLFRYLVQITMGISFEIQDPHGVLDKVRPAVLIGNHQAEFDLIMLGTIFPRNCSVTAKASLKKVPFLGWFMLLTKAIFIERANSKNARATMKKAGDQMATMRQSVYVFPEGTRSYTKDPVLLPFKKGGFHLAVEAGAPIVPCVVANYSHLIWLKEFVLRPGKIPVKVLEPIPTKGLTAADVDDLARKTRDLMLDELVHLTAEAQGKVHAPLPGSKKTK
ncbi:related to sn2-acylglyceride fatty acyltransferase [Cephalotrichum gorgonifer]|uniref:1-acyl-sn-glycerol-3-phosphate acyltransferase n=1 Tax=Cephalotrichum gorgonifer TaxID=2041049 RepID=A0AAE8MUW3_9PEZI|nr:related to sn2-acylglyceride fatty acyltransferase [Cephalotrichum gorgonifer]